MIEHLLTLAIVLGVCPAVQANIVIGGVDTFSLVNGQNDTLVFQQFNSSLGTLTNADFLIQVNTTGPSYDFDNESVVGGGVFADASAIGTFTAPNVSSSYVHSNNFFFGLFGNNAFVSADDDGAPDFAGNDWLFTGTSAEQSNLIGSATNVAPYIGLGTVNLDLASNQTGFAILQQNFSVLASRLASAGNVNGTVTLQYTFLTAVPEPSSLVLLGLAAFGLVARRNRQIDSAQSF